MTLLIKAVARAFAGQEGGNDVPPEMGGAVEAHGLEPGIGQRIEPGVEVGKGGANYFEQDLGAERGVNARERFAACRFATWR